MRPPRPLLGSPYEKDMFTFLPAHSNSDVLTDSSRKRKFISSDNQINMPAPTARFGFEMSGPMMNTGDWRGRVPQGSCPTPPLPAPPPHGQSLHPRDDSHVNQHWDRHNFAKTWDSKRDILETKSEYSKPSLFSGQLQSLDHQISSPLFQRPELPTIKSSNMSPPMSKNFNQFENCASQKHAQLMGVSSGFHDQAFKNMGVSQSLQKNAPNVGASVLDFDGKGCWTHRPSACSPIEGSNQLERFHSNAFVEQGKNVHHIQEFRNIGLEKHAELKSVASSSREQTSVNLGELHNSQPNAMKGSSIVSVDGKGCPAETFKVESSNVKQSGDACTSAGFDSTRMFGGNASNVAFGLQYNEILQNALRLLSSSYDIGLPGSYSGNTQGHGDVRITKLIPDSVSQTIKQSQMETSSSKEPCLNLHKSDLNGEKGPKLDEECKSENGVSIPTENLWDGTLHLSSSVSVSAIAFFKSGEKMQDFSWSKSVDVKGKVRLQAFEKYVQDLPRSRTRGLMVLSFCLKEGSSDSEQKGMMAVARKYKQGKRVGFAQLTSGLDMYICPNSDTIITILAKYGFFKGMSAVKDKCEPLLGCVVWRKNTSSITTTKTTKVNDTPPGPSMSSPSDSSTALVAEKHSDVPVKNEEPIIVPTIKTEQLTESGEKNSNNSPIAKNPMAPQNSESKTESNIDKPNLTLISVASKVSAVNSADDNDDEDLPEYDFRVVASQTSGDFGVRAVDSKLEDKQSRDSHMTAQMEKGSSTVQGPSSYFQGLIAQNMATEIQNQIQEHSASQNPPDFRGTGLENKRRQPDLMPSLPLQQQKQLGNNAAGSKPRNIFDDDDDMPEWCPPEFRKPRHDVAQRTVNSVGSSHSNVSMTCFANSTSSHPPPCLPNLPPFTPLQFQDKNSHRPRALADNKPAANRLSNKGFTPNPTWRG